VIWALAIIAGLVGLIFLVAIVGFLLPKGHVATSRLQLKQPPEAVWKLISNPDALTSWRKDLKKVERLNDTVLTTWRETGSLGVMTLEVVESILNRRIATRIADTNLPFGGTWTWILDAREGGCTVSITESGEVYNPFFRFMSRFVLGHHGAMRAILRDLAAHFGESSTPT